MKIRIIDSSARSTASEAPHQTGLHATRNHLPLIARILLSALFLWSGISKALHPAETQAYMADHGMLLTGLFLVAAIALEFVAGLSLLLGVYPRIGAAALALFTLVTAFIFHSNFADPMQQIQFMKNLSIIGGLLMVVQYGSGNIALRFNQRHS
jgi:putative oxidoreductase